MTNLAQRSPFRLSPLPASVAQHNMGAYWAARRLLWFVAGGVLVVTSLLAPALVNHEPAESPPVQRLSQPIGASQLSLTGSPATNLSSQRQGQGQRHAPPTPLPSRLTVVGADGTGAANGSGDRLLLPLVIQTQGQDARLPNPSSAQGSHRVVAQPTLDSAPAQRATGHHLFLATVMRIEGMTTLPASTTVSAANQAAPTQAAGALFLPLVANASVQGGAFLATLPQPATTAMPMPIATPAEGLPATPLPTPASAQAQQVLQQVQALRVGVEDLIERGVLPAAEGQLLLRQVTVVMRLPFLTLGVAPANPSPGQPRPGAPQLQLFIDHVDQLVARGLLPADQGQALLDQAQAIIQALGGG